MGSLPTVNHGLGMLQNKVKYGSGETMWPRKMKLSMLQTWNTWLFGLFVGNLGPFAKGSFIKMTSIWCVCHLEEIHLLPWNSVPEALVRNPLSIYGQMVPSSKLAPRFFRRAIWVINIRDSKVAVVWSRYIWRKLKHARELVISLSSLPWSFSFYRGDWVLIPFCWKGVSLSTSWTCEIDLGAFQYYSQLDTPWRFES